jgi:crotonobetainyl-CoA:carnitine CoA-transferase CaiB-like acyl-CoA transferase
VMNALYHRDARGGAGQVVDLAIIEPILMVLGNQAVVYDQLGVIPERTGNRSTNNAPRNTYRTRDGRWVAVSTSADTIARRVMELVGHPEVVLQAWFATGHGRAEHGDLLDPMVAGWIAERDFDEVVSAFEAAGAAIAPIYDIAQAMADPQYRALGTFMTIEDEDLGEMRMQNVIFRMLGTPGRVRFPGRRLGQDNEAVYRELGLDATELRARGTI